jgi:hypothetical protein
VSGEITQEQAQLEATQHEQISSIARALATPKTSACAELIKGVVTAYTYPYLTVQIGGDTATSIDQVRHLEAYSPVVGDTVTMVKQGADILAIGRVNTTTASPTLNGWVQPTLATGFVHSADPIRYRVINDHGDLSLQMRGSCTMTGSVVYSANVATVFTLPVGYRVALNSSILIPRDSGGTCVKINYLTSGVVQIDNLKGVRTDSDNAATATTSVDMQHFHDDIPYSPYGPGNTATGFAKYGTWPGSYTNGFPGGNPHTHLIPPHDHGMANTLPTSMWFTGTNIIL